MKENIRLGPFQTQILECKVKPLIGESAQVMVMPLKVGESEPGGAWPLPPGGIGEEERWIAVLLQTACQNEQQQGVRGGPKHVPNFPEERVQVA